MTGRPTKITEDKEDHLAQLLSIGCTVREACSLAKVGKSAFYERCKNDRQFAERMSGSAANPYLTARIVAVRAIESDPKLALRYLERYDDEFRLQKHTPPNQRKQNHASTNSLQQSFDELKTSVNKAIARQQGKR